MLFFRRIIRNFEKNIDHLYVNADEYPHLDKELGKKIVQHLDSKVMEEPWFFYCHLMDLKDPVVYPKEFDSTKFGNTVLDRNLSAIDVWIGKFLEKIDLSNTLFVISADHGKFITHYSQDLEKSFHKIGSIGKKSDLLRTIGKKPFHISQKFAKKIKSHKLKEMTPFERRNFEGNETELFDDLVKVPLFFIGYGIKNTKIITTQERSIDIFPTIIDLIGIPISDTSIDGKSNVSLLNDSQTQEETAYIESGSRDPKKPGEIIGIRTSNYKYFRSRNKPYENVQLYDPWSKR